MTTRPTADQVSAIPALLDRRVPPDWIDVNGHMNVQFYLHATAASTSLLIEGFGLDESYRQERRMGVFTVEHHLNYYGELRLGDRFTVHPTVLDRSARAAHMLVYLVDRERQLLSNTLEIALVHVGMDDRRPVAMPDDIAAGFDAHIEFARTLPFDPPVCGTMGIRR